MLLIICVLAGFQFESFQFVDTDDAIIIECDVVICDPHDNDCIICASRRRRSAASDLKTFSASVSVNMKHANNP